MYKSQLLKSAQVRGQSQNSGQTSAGNAGGGDSRISDRADRVKSNSLSVDDGILLSRINLAKSKALRDLDIGVVSWAIDAPPALKHLTGSKCFFTCAVHRSLLRPWATRAAGLDVVNVLFAGACHGLVPVLKNANNCNDEIQQPPKNTSPNRDVRSETNHRAKAPILLELHTSSPMLPMGWTRGAWVAWLDATGSQTSSNHCGRFTRSSHTRASGSFFPHWETALCVMSKISAKFLADPDNLIALDVFMRHTLAHLKNVRKCT